MGADEDELLPQAVVDAVGFGTHPLVPAEVHKKLQRSLATFMATFMVTDRGERHRIWMDLDGFMEHFSVVVAPKTEARNSDFKGKHR